MKVAFQRGWALLEDRDCIVSEIKVGNIEDLLLVVLVDLVVYCIELIAEDPTNKGNMGDE